jgi:hypothetical protein
MIFWSLCASIWFKNMKKMLLQMTSGFLQLESTICIFLICESIFFNHGSVLQQKDIKILRESQRQILKI